MQRLDFDIDVFLRDYWQKKPLLIRNPWANWVNPLEPDDLAGLACESGVESRLITCTSERWALEHGPVDETRFGQLGRKPWTMLVQAVDHYVADVAALVAPFRFVPNWRIDDVMVSYATDGGGVGPHFDQYDVFLVQGLGRRRWQVGAPCDDSTPLLPHDHLRLLANFEPTQEWILEPGDILHVPPRVPHDGVAIGDDCMTYSIGFRAPSRQELVADWCDHLAEELRDEDRYADPDLRAQENPGEIMPDAIDRLHAMVTQAVADRDAFARWFGAYNSTPRYPDADWRPEQPVTTEDARAWLGAGTPLYRNPASRFSFIRQDGDGLLLFVDGECHECTGDLAAFAARLCAREQLPVDPGLARSDSVPALVATLLNQGSVTFEPED